MKSVIVVGAGIWGTSLALQLAETGWRVTLVEQYVPGHVRQASAGETRLLRMAHGTGEWYSRLAWRSRDLWLALSARTGEDLFAETGLMWFARRLDGWEADSLSVLRDLDIPARMLSPQEAARAFPSFKGEDLAGVLFEPNAGVLRARRATQVVARLAVQAGVRLVRGRAEPLGNAVYVGDETLTADRVVWACGAWLPKLFDVPITVTRQDTLHFDVPWDAIPAFCDYEGSAYGHGDVDGVGMKASSDVEGPPFDPVTGERSVLPASEEAARAYLRRRFPAVAGAPVLFSQVCQYASTPDGEWLIAEAEPGVWLLGGDSGHGFKHAPALAEYVATLLEGAAPDPRFAMGDRTVARGLRTSGLTG